MKTITYDAEFFNPKDTLECGQLFRFKNFEKGYKVFSADKACYVYTDGVTTYVQTDHDEYFYDYFDLNRDYSQIVRAAESFFVPLLTHSARAAKGLRLLNQDKEETVFSFIISQNNNIPRIKKIIESICCALGEKKFFMGEEYYSFPSSSALAEADASFFRSVGAGYRDTFLCETAKRIKSEGLERLIPLNAESLKKELLTYKGVGAKVADCISLFGFKKTESFPVDTWIEKVYREDFGGTLTDRNKIAEYFKETFGEYSGYVQQYLFYGKRQHL